LPDNHLGGARAPPTRLRDSLSTPHQIENPSLERPVFNPFRQTFAQRIFLNINPFLGMILAIPQPVMPAARLKLLIFPSVFEAKFAFPVGNPCFDGKPQILRRTKRMQMIRH